MGRPRKLANITLKVDADDLTWACVRALVAGTSVNRLIRNFLTEYAAVPAAFRNGEKWRSESGRAGETFAEILDPRDAGRRAREEAEGGP
jgi:hypothetical protein